MLSKERLLGILEQETMLLTTPMNGKDKDAVRGVQTIHDKYAQVIRGQGDLQKRSNLKELCSALDTSHEELKAGGVSEELLTKAATFRRKMLRELEMLGGWRAEPLLKGKGSNKKPTNTCLRGVNRFREMIGMKVLCVNGEEYLTAEELQASLSIASILGDTAVAEFWSAVKPERFDYNNRTIQNLRQWIGEFQVYKGNPLVDVPVLLLTLPSLSSLRQLLFNRLRDKYYRDFYKKSKNGVDPVITELASLRETVPELARQQFIDELIDYFLMVENLPIPQRLRESLGAGTEFPAKHQRISVVEIARQRQLLLADRMGGGKTGSSILAFEHLRDEGKAKRALIQCPSHIVGEWEKRLTDKNGGYFKEGHAPKVVVIRPSSPKYPRTSEIWEDAKSADYVIMSIEMTREETDGKRNEDWVKEIGANFMVLDEAHNVRNPDGADTERIFRISQSESIRNGHLVVSTGTPVYNTIRDIAAQLRLLNAGQQRIMDAEGIPKGLDFSNIKELSNAIARNHTRLVRNLLLLRMLARDTEDCLPVGTNLEVPEPREDPLLPLERAKYDAIFENPFLDANEKIRALRNLCMQSTAKYNQVLNATREVIEEHRQNPQSHPGKVLLAATGDAKGVTRDFNDDNDPETSDIDAYMAGKLRRELGEEDNVPVVILDGEQTGSTPLRENGKMVYDIDGAPLTKTRQKIAESRDPRGPAVLVLRTDVGGEGIDLSYMARGFMIAPTSVKSEEDQMIYREYRKGQKFSVRFQTLMIADSIERGMWEFARRKARIIDDLLNGKPLSQQEEDILNEEVTRVRRHGILAYETKTPRQKKMYIFKRLFDQGKDAVREFFKLDEGRYAKDLAKIYFDEREYSHEGNNRRLIMALLQKYAIEARQRTELKSKKPLRIADVASGCMTLAHSLSEQSDVEVWSSDICAPMLEIGQKSFGDAIPSQRVSECSMDQLPYEDGSMHMVVHSLALHYTKHNPQKPKKGGEERICALRELNRVLAMGGVTLLALPPHTFKDEEHFLRFCEVLETHFGLQIQNDTGMAYSADNDDEEPFKSYIATFIKVGEPTKGALPKDAELALYMGYKRPSNNDREKKPPKTGGTKPPPGSYHERFTIGGKEIAYVTPENDEVSKKKHQAEKKRYKKVCQNIQRLIDAHGDIEKIPEEELLSISLEELGEAQQRVKDQYFRTLLKKYKGRAQEIPIEEINRESSVVLQRVKTNKGWFLCLANIDELTGKVPKGGYGKKYFYQEEFKTKEV